MKRIKWMKKWRRAKSSPANDEPLREFIYLDEVSLRSLLSSQTGEMTESISNQTANSFDAEVGSSISAGVPQISNAELTSRFQTSNSSTLQTSRKATVQSWFREFYKRPKLRVVEPQRDVPSESSPEELIRNENKSVCIQSEQLQRGELVEFRVKLSPDPIFHLGTMVSEFSGMAEDFPGMFAENNALETLKQMQPVNRILQRLLAGLIPVKAEAIDYVVVEVGNIEYVVHRDAVSGLGLKEKPLVIVGVTEHLAYWKDIRRVLFSEAEFTILSRISRSGLQTSWTPVKLADLFRDLVPGLVEQINTASQNPATIPSSTNEVSVNADERLFNTLLLYKSELLQETGAKISKEQDTQVDEKIRSLLPLTASVTEQRAAFSAVKAIVANFVEVAITPSEDLELREKSRQLSGLPLFPQISVNQQPTTNQPVMPRVEDDQRLLDVDFVAIYW
jgi:hypothetical protein